MSEQPNLGGTFTFPNTNLTINRLGYGAMQLAGPHVFGPPRDPEAARTVLREAVAQGINHIDTSDFYGPHVTNELIRQALHPYPDNLLIVTKVGARRGSDASWLPAMSPKELTEAVHDNLRNLKRDALDIVNLRSMDTVDAPHTGSGESIAEPLSVLIDLKRQGLIRHIGLSNVNQKHLDEARSMTEIVCVQNLYNLANRTDDAFIDRLNDAGIAYVPYFPLGGFSPIQSTALTKTAEKLGATPMQVALAWLLHRSPNILLIPGTSSVDHLHENLKAADVQLSPDVLAELDTIGSSANATAH